ncbi:Ionotropic glutamate receptor [Syntrophomonas zehnderi OL-4]|uniref:Ionotropic glutamate receptor n=1 Tax=Syntrophomonas zehnderi OL-4 TaxID=690567 RepID=A0A0E4C8M5_9FIRM|nr:basic amino acid ABC transporter substrate-binding protein [Syntrophomonas zehnderi]CFX57654.1 Ionotropic glutamate receptor [Syntrophomonas zehnderi OL-4]
MKKITAILVSALLVMGMLVTVSGCGKNAADNQDQEKVLRVVTEAGFKPFEFKENNEFVGFDMDLIRAIAEAEGYKAEITHMGFESLIPALQSNKADCAIAGMSIDEERKKSVDFSTPYFNAGLIIAVQKDTEGIKSPDDLKGKRIAGQVGTIGADACNDIKKQDPNTTVKIFDSVGEAFMELEKGGIDAVINDYAVTYEYISTTGQGKTKIVGDVFSADDQYGIAVKKGNKQMLNVINDGLEKVKASGKYDEIYQKWIKQ